jgi:hypothetical protein
MSSILSSVDLLDPEGPACSLNHLVSLFPISILAFNFPNVIIFVFISITSSCILVMLEDLLSLNSKAKLGTKSPMKFIFAVGFEGLTSTGILLYSLLNL